MTKGHATTAVDRPFISASVTTEVGTMASVITEAVITSATTAAVTTEGGAAIIDSA